MPKNMQKLQTIANYEKMQATFCLDLWCKNVWIPDKSKKTTTMHRNMPTRIYDFSKAKRDPVVSNTDFFVQLNLKLMNFKNSSKIFMLNGIQIIIYIWRINYICTMENISNDSFTKIQFTNTPLSFSFVRRCLIWCLRLCAILQILISKNLKWILT